MEYRQLGRSGLRVSALTLGTMAFGGRGGFRAVGTTDVGGARRQVDMCLDAGINMIDTADVYSGGTRRGDHRRGDQGSPGLHAAVHEGAHADGRRAERRRAVAPAHHHGCEASLRRLGTSHIDIYQLHEWDGQTRSRRRSSALDHLVQQGKVRYVGLELRGLAAHEGTRHRRRTGCRDSRAAGLLLAGGRDAEYELVPAAVDQGLGILVWSPLAGGLLSGKYRRDAATPGRPADLRQWDEPPVQDEAKLHNTVEALSRSARRAGPRRPRSRWPSCSASRR